MLEKGLTMYIKSLGWSIWYQVKIIL